MTKFWEKVEKCDHTNLSPDYCEPLYCSTPYCNGYEMRCLDCGVYITQCKCGCENGMSGWPDKRYRKLWRNK